jgi:16S rRNA (guanine527-N7)-methyltransferase
MRIFLSSALIILPGVISFELSHVFTGHKYRSHKHHFGLAPLLLSPRNGDSDSDESFYVSSIENTSDDSLDDVEASASSLWELDPTSELAKEIVLEKLGLTSQQFKKLQQLSTLVTEWNERINLVSRKDCNPSTVFARHILPSIAACALSGDADADAADDSSANAPNPLSTAKHVVDVGTGGGFPGLPLAIAYPDTEFVLLDSIGKKLTAVQAMADELKLTNVKTHHGRAEDLVDQKFDVATGRSVSAIPQFCAWMQHLLKPGTGRVMYWIGGDIPEDMLSHALSNDRIQELVPKMKSDKKIIVIPQAAVKQIARESGLIVKPTKIGKPSAPKPNKENSKTKRNKSRAKGSWKRNDPDAPKQRGYEDFKRYSSNNSI